ncbi:uncharacterized protein JCM15063_004428 [Sporobolomyces koalae]|uniref:uncharacterized protein n=1 Tax=Sporobolomyces koalae TaxID=500713 RepID=UPI0031756561
MTDHVVRRLSHPHYCFNSLLCVPYPVLLLVASSSPTRAAISSTLSTSALLLLALPLALALFMLVAPVVGSVSPNSLSSDHVESIHASLTFQLRLLNLFGLWFSRAQFGTGKRTVALYLLTWLATSFFYPQPPYLGPHHLTELTSAEFDAQVLLLPTPRESALDFLDSSAKITDLPDDKAQETTQDRTHQTRSNLVLFHVDFSKTSRQLQMTIARLSHRFDSPSLKFFVVTPESASTTFYDLSLSTTPTSTDLPLLRMYRRGKVVREEPLGELEATEILRSERRQHKTRRSNSPSRVEDSESESEDERRVDQKRAVERWKWDRSERGFERRFKLRERSRSSDDE